jgi:hypothetical protein
VKVATPLLFNVAEPIAVPLLRNETVPVGVPEDEVTATVMVADCPVGVGFGLMVRVEVVAGRPAALTVSLMVLEAEEAKLLLPAYCADRLYVPTARDDIWMDAAPEPLRVALPREELPARKVTVPVGLPEVAETVAVRVIAWPATTWLADVWRSVAVWVAAEELTDSATADEVEAAKFELPAYCAVRV